MEIKDEHIVKLLALKLQTADNNTNFANLLNEDLELVMRSKQVREYALNHWQLEPYTLIVKLWT